MELTCKCDNRLFKILLNRNPIQFVVVCLNCSRAFIISPNDYEKYLLNTEWEFILEDNMEPEDLVEPEVPQRYRREIPRDIKTDNRLFEEVIFDFLRALLDRADESNRYLKQIAEEL